MDKKQNSASAETDQSTDMARLVSLLKSLDAAVPEAQGALSLKLFADMTGRFDLEMWGAPVASGKLGEEILVDRGLVVGSNPDWLPDVESLVARLNSILANAIGDSRAVNAAPPQDQTL